MRPLSSILSFRALAAVLLVACGDDPMSSATPGTTSTDLPGDSAAATTTIGGTTGGDTGADTARGGSGTVVTAGFPAEYVVDPSAPDYVIGQDWQPSSGVSTVTDLQALDLFWSDSACFPADLYVGGTITLAPDPLFQQVVDIAYPACPDPGAVQHDESLGTPQSRIWFRAIYRWKAPYTSAGANPKGYANSQKHMFVTWEGANSRKEWEYSNTTDYILGLDFRHTDSYNTKYGFTEAPFAGQSPWTPVATEWTDDEWYEFVFWYEVTQPGPYGTVIEGSWKRRLTQKGVIAPSAWEWQGSTITFTDNPLAPGTGESPPLARSARLFANRNKSVDQDFHIQVGPYVVLNSADPWGLRAAYGL